MKTIRPLLLLLLSVCLAYSAPIPASRLPVPGYWNPGCIGANGLTYRQTGTFVPPVVLTNIINVKNPPYNAVGDGVHDDTTNIQAAIAAGNDSVIYLPAGIYKTTHQLELANPNYNWSYWPKILRGAGPTNTFILGCQTSGSAIIDASGSEPGTSRAAYLAQPVARGATNITLSSWDSGGFFNTQNWGIIYESNSVAGPPWNGGQGYEVNARSQIVHIIARNASTMTITFDTPLYMNWDTNAMFTVFYSADSPIGIENLCIQNVSDTNGYGLNNINFSGVFNSWIYNVQSSNAYNGHIELQDCGKCDVINCCIHNYYPLPGIGGGNSDYGVWLFGQTSDCLVMNNCFERCRHAMVAEYGDTGNVFAYNYNQNPINQDQETTDYLMGDMLQHGSTQFNLWEGNVASNFRMDDAISGSVYNMSFRNNMTRISIPTVNLGQWGYDIQVSNYWVSVIASVMNNVSYNPTWRVGAPDGNGDYPAPPCVNDCFTSPVGTPADPGPTLWVDGVVDLQSNVVMWATNGIASLPPVLTNTYPASLFLTSAPSFWPAGLPWPAIGPDVAGYKNVIPAQTEYAGYVAWWNGLNNMPAPPTQLKIIN